MLDKLARHAPRGSEAALFARCRLAELLVENAPWRAALQAREVLQHQESDRAWAVLGLAHTLLGNYRAARGAYRRALELAPDCPRYLHNLGHLLDVALDRPGEAVALLRAAHREEPAEVEIATSLAHALVRAGRRRDAVRVLKRATRSSDAAIDATLSDWLTQDPPGSGQRASLPPANVEPEPRARRRRSEAARRPPGD